ncbi:uncharacterized protein LOC128503894 [Spea bombifrons]|uniref:uncharacterized protein LOC128503894 n=1 Tax=Spea bombifrons TaxID=233779 RepID=UPI00234B38C7|nr:uncharacterized protein LOC128503894 [Spea bombifrons]
MWRLCAVLLLPLVAVRGQADTHLLTEVLFCQPDAPVSGLLKMFDDDLMFTYNFSDGSTAPRMADFNKWAGSTFPNRSTISKSLKLCKDFLNNSTNKLEDFTPEAKANTEVRVFTARPLTMGEPNTLICFVSNVFPPVVTITWTKKGEEVTEGVRVTGYSAALDQTYQVFSYLNFTPHHQDEFSCMVHTAEGNYTTVGFWVPMYPVPSDLLENVLCGLALALGILCLTVGVAFLTLARKQRNNVTDDENRSAFPLAGGSGTFSGTVPDFCSTAEMRGTRPLLLLYIYIIIYILSSVTGFVVDEKAYCSFGDEKEGDVTFEYGLSFNRMLMASFSKTDGRFFPCQNCPREMSELAVELCAELNSEYMVTLMKEKEDKCKKDAVEYWENTVERTAKPSMKVFLAEPVHDRTQNTLVCHVWGFYPSSISVTWLKNDDTITSNNTDAIPRGDWTYQIVALQDLRDALPDDKYTCVVEHSSLENVVMDMSWKQGLTSAQIIKISVATVVFCAGIIFALVGFWCWKNSKRSGYTPLPGYNNED